jgi:hypothetical protein
MDILQLGERALFVESFSGFEARRQVLEFLGHYGTYVGVAYGSFLFVNKDGGIHNLDGRLPAEFSKHGLYIPYDCIELMMEFPEND